MSRLRIELIMRRGKDGKWGRCKKCGRFVGFTPGKKHEHEG